MGLPLTLRTAHATCTDAAPLPGDRRLEVRDLRDENAVLAAAQDRFAANGWPIGAESNGTREFFQTLDRFLRQGIPARLGLSCASGPGEREEPFATEFAGGGAVLLDPEAGQVQLTRIRYDNAKDFGSLLRDTLDGVVPDLTLAGLPTQSNARRSLVAAVPSALKSYLPWTGTHEAHVLPALAIAIAALQGEIPAKTLRLPEAPLCIAVVASQGRSFLGILLLRKQES